MSMQSSPFHSLLFLDSQKLSRIKTKWRSGNQLCSSSGALCLFLPKLQIPVWRRVNGECWCRFRQQTNVSSEEAKATFKVFSFLSQLFDKILAKIYSRKAPPYKDLKEELPEEIERYGLVEGDVSLYFFHSGCAWIACLKVSESVWGPPHARILAATICTKNMWNWKLKGWSDKLFDMSTETLI